MILPDDIISQHIMPYAYCPQSPELIKDIRKYTFILNKIVDIYNKYYQLHSQGVVDLILQFDILSYYEKIMNKDNSTSLTPFIQSIDTNRKYDCNYKSRLFRIILGKLKPVERLKLLLNMMKSLELRNDELED